MGRIIRILWVAGALPLLAVVFLWLRSHWWVDELTRKGDGGSLVIRTEGGLAIAWEEAPYAYYWWPPPQGFFLFEAPEWELSLSNDPDPDKARWFGFGPYAGADFSRGTGSGAWSILIPWWPLAITSGLWAWLMWLAIKSVKRRRAREFTLQRVPRH